MKIEQINKLFKARVSKENLIPTMHKSDRQDVGD